MKLYRFDLLISYWFFAWFVLYYFRFIPYSPKLALLISSISGAGLLIWMLLGGSELEKILFTTFMAFLIKFIPLYLVIDEKINYSVETKQIFILGIVYLLWSWLTTKNKPSIYNTHYDDMFAALSKNGKTDPESTPALALFVDIKKWMNNI